MEHVQGFEPAWQKSEQGLKVYMLCLFDLFVVSIVVVVVVCDLMLSLFVFVRSVAFGVALLCV